jgi:hypothetical protein
VSSLKVLLAKKPVLGSLLGLVLMVQEVFADNQLSLTGLSGNVDNSEFWFIALLEIVLTLAGVMLVLKGLVHLKQQYTSGGGGQEKHLSKGIASCVFGACMFLVVPIAHMFSGSIGGAATPSWNIADGTAGSITPSLTSRLNPPFTPPPVIVPSS